MSTTTTEMGNMVVTRWIGTFPRSDVANDYYPLQITGSIGSHWWPSG